MRIYQNIHAAHIRYHVGFVTFPFSINLDKVYYKIPLWVQVSWNLLTWKYLSQISGGLYKSDPFNDLKVESCVQIHPLVRNSQLSWSPTGTNNFTGTKTLLEHLSTINCCYGPLHRIFSCHVVLSKGQCTLCFFMNFW